MNIGIISVRYAKALYDFACKNSAEDVVYSEMASICGAFVKVPRLREALVNPALGRGDCMKLIASAAGGVLCDTTKKFIALMYRHRREEMLQFVAGSYIRLYRDSKNIHVLKFVTAVPVDGHVEEKMRRLVNAGLKGTVEFEKIVDPEIIGGFVLQLGSNRLDASVKRQLQVMEHNLLGSESSDILTGCSGIC